MSPVPKKSLLDESIDYLVASDDISQSGFIGYKVAVSDITASANGIYSPEIEVLGLPWFLNVEKADNDLDVYLYHRESDCDMWSIDTFIEFKIVNNDGVNHKIITVLGTYNCKKDSWGMDVMKWEDAINEEKGFIKDGKIIIEARFKISNLVGIRINTYIDFSDPNEPFHDVALVMNGEKIYASKQILAIHSSHFKDLFYGADSDKNKKEFELNHVDRKEFVEMLKLIYPSYTKISDVNAKYLLDISDRYQIKENIDNVEKFLIELSKFDILVKLNLSDRYRLVKLQEHCLNTLKSVKDITDLQPTSGYKALSRSAKATLLEKIMKLSNPPVPMNPRLIECLNSLMTSSDGSPSGFIRFEVAVSDITPDGIFSPAIEVLGIPWTLKVKKNVNPPSLGVYLYSRRSESDIWSIDVSAEFFLLNSDEEKNVHDTPGATTINHMSYWGYGSQRGISKWEDVTNEEKGFVKDGKITIEVRFLLCNITGIRVNSHVDFTDPKEPFHDVALMIGGEKIYVSKQILAVHSPVFKAMFYHDFVEKNKELIELKDVDREVFIDMLNLIYPSYKKITDTNAEPLLKLADQYQIKTIIDQVEKFLIDSTKFNIPAKLKLSEQYRLVTLQEHCLNTFETTDDIMKLKRIDGFDDLSKNMKGTLLMKAMDLD